MNVTNRLGDADIRGALRSLLLAQHEPDTVLLEELGFCRGQARIDLAAVNGLLHGYEIKSDRDSLRRLAGQTAMFSRVLDLATLVVGERLAEEGIEHVPGWWGILKVARDGDGLQFSTLRCPRRNPSRDPRALVELIWLDTALRLLEERGVARGVRGKPRRLIWDRICEHFDLDEIAMTVRTQLRARLMPSPAARPS